MRLRNGLSPALSTVNYRSVPLATKFTFLPSLTSINPPTPIVFSSLKALEILANSPFGDLTSLPESQSVAHSTSSQEDSTSPNLSQPGTRRCNGKSGRLCVFKRIQLTLYMVNTKRVKLARAFVKETINVRRTRGRIVLYFANSQCQGSIER